MGQDISDLTKIAQEMGNKSLIKVQLSPKPLPAKKGLSNFPKWEEVSDNLYIEEANLYTSTPFFIQQKKILYDSFFILFLNKEPNENISRFYKLCWIYLRFIVLKSSMKTAVDFTDQKFYLIKRLQDQLTLTTDSEKREVDAALKEIQNEFDPKRKKNVSDVELEVVKRFIKQVIERAKISNPSNQKSKRSQLVLARIKSE